MQSVALAQLTLVSTASIFPGGFGDGRVVQLAPFQRFASVRLYWPTTRSPTLMQFVSLVHDTAPSVGGSGIFGSAAPAARTEAGAKTAANTTTTAPTCARRPRSILEPPTCELCALAVDVVAANVLHCARFLTEMFVDIPREERSTPGR